MNRLVIIGNGFDLAHGLPTSYGDFINYYWGNIVKVGYDFLRLNNTEYEDSLIKINVNLSGFDYYGREKLLKEYVKINTYTDFKFFISNYDCDKVTEGKVIFKNSFFGKINELHSTQNWVDIENLYYSELKRIVKSKCLDISKTEEYWEKEQKKEVKKLNEEFELLKILLEKYLSEEVIKIYQINLSKLENKDWLKIYNYLQPISLFNNEDNILKEFLNKEDILEIKNHFNKEKREEIVNKIHYLSFNYTTIVNAYCKILNEDDRVQCEVNSIHGELENDYENKINFGFGDEMDDDYKSIENINDNEYLKNFKSFQYLQNSNYSNLLSYIDSDKFQVLIMGHSCGLSDRTLLNTIFEHNNCRSIKVFYHQREDSSDNYTEIIQNISRHFNKKKLMREKIVNKMLCQPLPQIQLPKKV